jgi:hypothetical protein
MPPFSKFGGVLKPEGSCTWPWDVETRYLRQLSCICSTFHYFVDVEDLETPVMYYPYYPAYPKRKWGRNLGTNWLNRGCWLTTLSAIPWPDFT